MKKEKFEPKKVKFYDKKYEGAMSGIFCIGNDAKILFGEKWSYGAAFAYMFRRFGYPPRGWDDYKELACYYITTPEPELYLCVSPRLSAGTSFGYCGTLKKIEGFEMNRDLRPRGHDALVKSMRSLLIPTNVRDWYINILGEYDEDIDLGFVEPSDEAGYGGFPDDFLKERGRR